ncbi:MAG: deoxyribodipyrimidine photolyase [Gemmatimonadaceae bacterium]|nr:deoxyribodipyrimidine photolyase [Gemmatimonadaceae bacterium]NUO93686.1 deoxyribodipyrimidine photolyase [Gemmatimonadaceae bacterium]NUP72127.1 deoxyribodipyrimidine photolyase [Gemmatimonadaceae bacterium]NUR36230.1 deoxyribodipyrimidine photolyase [Gemmatimonadaceae bacterium]NUS34749.1 deoxyribodipyrimidine photolyase [Gemmatimonadaceae bacterium]
MKHPLGSPYVRDQLSLRALPLNEKRLQPEGEFVLYWMQSTQRLEDNWALRLATIEADRVGKPLLIHQGLEPSSTYASARFHTFVMQGAREIARRADSLGLTYRFTVRRRLDDDARVLDRLASRAALVVTDLFPTGGVSERSQRLADRVNCRVLAVDSVGVVPAASFHKEEYAARTIRPKLAKLLDLALEPVDDRAPKRAMPAALLASLNVDWLDLAHCDIAAEVARCEIDHEVGPVAARGGLAPARARLHGFVEDGLRDYAERRRHPSDDGGSSRLSPYLHNGMISPMEVVSAVRRSASAEQAEAFLNEMLTWRELSLNFCLRNAGHGSLTALPDWVHRSMRAHADDERETTYTLEELEDAATHDPIWNAGQRELVQTGQMHNVVRMLWGKSVITWTETYEQALTWLLHLNNKYALDGRDPNSFAGIQWCFGKFDRPFASRPVWGTIRPMSLARAHTKYDVAGYLGRWNGAKEGELALA